MSDAITPWYQQVPSFQTGQANPGSVDPTEGADPTEGSSNPATKAAEMAQYGLVSGTLPGGQQQPGASDAPPLPNATGNHASEPVTAKAAGNASTSLSEDDRPITSLAQAFDVLSDVAGETMLQNGKLKNIFTQNQVGALQQSAEAQIDQVEGERKSAANKLIGACVATVAVGVTGFMGGAFQLGGANGTAAGVGAALAGAGGAVTQLTTAMTSYLDTCASFGGQHQADEAKIRKAVQDIFVQMYKSQEDSFNNEYENARKAVQNVMDMKRAVDDNTNQVTLNIMQNV